MQPYTEVDKEAVQLRLRQQFGREQMPYYIEQARKQFLEPNPPDWIFLYKEVDRGNILFIRCQLWQTGTSGGSVYGCSSFGYILEKIGSATPAKDTIVAETIEGCLTPEDSILLILLAQQSPRQSLKNVLPYLKVQLTSMLHYPFNHCRTEAVILRRRPSGTPYIQNMEFFLFLNRKVVSALRDTLRKIVNPVGVGLTVSDVI